MHLLRLKGCHIKRVPLKSCLEEDSAGRLQRTIGYEGEKRGNQSFRTERQKRKGLERSKSDVVSRDQKSRCWQRWECKRREGPLPRRKNLVGDMKGSESSKSNLEEESKEGGGGEKTAIRQSLSIKGVWAVHHRLRPVRLIDFAL